MANNRDRNWDRDQQHGGFSRSGGWQGGEDYGRGEQGQQHDFEDSQGRGSWREGREHAGSGQQGGGGNWQGSGGSGPQQSGEWNRMGRYNEESSHGGGQGRWGQGGNNRMDRDFGESGSRGNWGGSGNGSGFEGMNRPFVGESSFGDSRRGSGSGGFGYGGQGSGNYGSGSNSHGSGSFGGRSSYGSGGYGSDSSYGQQGQRGQRGFMDRATDEVSSWFGDDEARRRREMDEHRGRGPKGYTRSDERIREDVNDRLTDDGWLDASDIDVQVSSSEVTLTGHVNSREEKRRAEDIVEAISGVRHVQNNLRVKDRNASAGKTSTTEFGSGSGTAGASVSGSSTSGSAESSSGATGSGSSRSTS